ncbi:Histone-lysine N-methyltransferase ezh1 [Gurleya vavrai]
MSIDEPCSKDCYLTITDKTIPILTQAEEIIFQKVNKNFQPSPCISFLSLYYLFETKITCAQLKNLTEKFNSQNVKYKKIIKTGAIKHDINVHYNPCSHTGSCNKNKDCTCFTNQTFCEFMCGCESCDMIFEGCSCLICLENCKCQIASRECTFLCHKRKNSLDCGNKGIFMNKHANVHVGESLIAGYGLFASEEIKNGSFVIEYVGEVISHNEAEIRGFFYDQRKISYLFDLSLRNEEEYSTIDATRFGNEARFINHSTNANLNAKQMVVNGVLRMGMYAKRNIKRGEELFFDYKYNDSIKRIFNLKD